ncbi:TolB family protein, partial [Acidobacteriota bacterium]
VFVTDRYSTDLSILSMGKYELALLDPEGGQITKIQGFASSNNINPQWSPDSKNLYFISDETGIANLHKIDIEHEKIEQITNLFTGISGIASLSPALSVAFQSGDLAFSVYEDGYYSLYSMDGSKNNGLIEGRVNFGDIQPAVLPPREKGGGGDFGTIEESSIWTSG